MKIRVGNGFDVHKLSKGTEIILCGVVIPHDKKLLGHSDADVAMHALTDAILGALCEGDIGVHFPPTEPNWKGVSSKIFLKKATSLLVKNRYSIVNLDITIICESPMIKKYSLEMRKNIAFLTNIAINQVSIKGTTTEHLGFIGRDEGIAAMSTVLIEKNE